MNWLFFIFGVPCGAVTFLIGEKLSKKLKKPWLQHIPLVVFCVSVIIIDIVM